MLKAFVWMFHYKELGSHIKYLLTRFIALFILILALGAGGFILFNKGLMLFSYIILPIILLMLISIVCLFPGYLWELTENIICRKADVLPSNVYDGRVKYIEAFDLPELEFKRIVWRGFSSMVAILISYIPLLLFLYFFKYNIEHGYTNPIVFLPLLMLVLFFVPAQLWYYARTNSIISVLNIRKVIYLTGNYPFRYIFRCLEIITIAIVNNIIQYFMANAISSIFATLNITLIVITCIIAALITLVLNIYLLLVFAYLIGTLAPAGEN